MKNKDMILIIDFGSPYNQLLTRKVRKLGVYSELHSYKITAAEIQSIQPKGIILSGSPHSVHDAEKFTCDEAIFDLDIPILGICYGMHLMTQYYGGEIVKKAERTYEQSAIKTLGDSPLFKDSPNMQNVWMSFGDHVQTLPTGFDVGATGTEDEIVTIFNEAEKRYGIQFDPQVETTVYGDNLLEQFLFQVCACDNQWSMSFFIEDEVQKIRQQVGDKKVLCALSGGVDSSVVAVLLHKAIGDQLTCIFVDHGLLRKNEADDVMKLFAEDFKMNIIKVDAQDRFLNKLKGVSDPEQKRKIIGNEFIYVFDDKADQLKDIDYLAQGTLYSDVIESGTDTGKMVKSHHNVGGLPENMQFELIEPIKTLFKDEVRELGTTLGMPKHIVWRQPFPGPGLGIRVLGEVTKEKLHIVREADAILREEIAMAGLDRDIWQYFAVLPNIRSVGVRDDARSYDYTVGIRAVNSVDGMTSDWARIDWEILDKISRRIVSDVDQVNRVVYDITSKPPATIEWE